MRTDTADTYILGEEIANAVSHGVGLLVALAATPVLIVSAAGRGALSMAGVSVFAATVVLLYLASTLYHALPPNRAKRVFRIVDHGAIYLLIAGTYTPFTFGILRGPWGWTLFGIVWTVAIAGVILKAVGGFRYPRFSTVLYIALGWIVIVAIRPLWALMPVSGWVWLVAGGLAYTGGVAFYAAERLRYAHLVWHLFVLAGTACHYCAVLWYST
ncbi:MAG: hemolysin III family protein [Acidobacteria bacterium]|nr:hemolysin III family protein [Acidobacteriota bacterium]